MEGSLCALRTGLHNQPKQEEGIWPYRVVVLCGWAARNRGEPPFFAVRPDTLGHIGLCGGRERVCVFPPGVWVTAVSYSPTPWRVQYHRRWRA